MKKILFIFAAVLLGSVGLHAGTQITYTASERLDGYEGSLEKGATTFGPAITNHEFSDGKGTITCSGEITEIGDNAFQNCNNLTSIDIPNSVTSIGNSAFLGCGLVSVTIGNSVTWIGAGAFFNCTNLPSIVIPNSVTTIRQSAFNGCTSLTSVTVSWTDAQSIVSINSNVFQGIANNAGPQGAILHVPTGTYNLYHQADGWKDFIITVPNSIITYYASEKLSDPAWGALDEGKTTFGPAITKHEFSNGIGVITCAGEITKIGERAFYGDKMTSISIPNTVKTIEYEAFYACDVLTSIEIPNLVTSIGYDAFYDCHGLKTVYCYALDPPTVGSNAFANVPQDISVYTFNTDVYKITWGVRLPASCFKPITAEVGGIQYEFFDCNKARVVAKEGGYTQSSIIVPEQVTYQDRTFTVTEIGQNAFYECKSLTSITLPNSITSIGGYAFSNCSALTSIIIPNSVTEIGERAFWGCGLTSVTIPASVKEIGFVAFKNCTNLDSLEFAKRESTNPINIDTYVFENTALTSVVIPDWMKEIPKGLFYKNSQLKAIYLHTSVENINYQSFGECKNLKYIFSVSQTPPALAEGAFEGHDKNDSVIVYVPSQDAKVAYQNSNWNKYFTKFVTDIEYRIISTSDKTAEVVSAIPFEGKVSIPGTTILDGIYYNVIGIGDSTFKYNELLTSISLSPTLKYIGNDAFYYCKKLKKVQLPEDLQTIGDRAFSYTALDTIVIPEGVQSLGKAAFAHNTLHYVSLPIGLKNIPDECFRNCYFGTEIIVPEGVETIGTRGLAFAYSAEKVALITLPSTLKEIKDYAFENRNGLKEVICLAPTPPTLGVNVFTNKDIAIVYVPNRDVLRTYRDSSLWKNYKFKFDDLMAKTNKAYLYEVAGSNKEAQEIARQYCDSIDKATTAKQVEFFTNKALALIDPYTLNDYKGRLADTLESIANTCPDSSAKLIALGIAAEYRNKIMSAIFRQDAEKIFAEGLAKINEVFELVELKKTCCNNLRNSAQNLGKEIIEIAEDFCKQINNAITKEEVNKIYKEGSQVIAMYTYINFYWSGSPDDGCQTTKGYYDEVDK